MDDRQLQTSIATPQPARGGGEPWLSVLIPVHNVAPYLQDCLQSIASQADSGVEILLLDDASSDGSAQILAVMQERWHRRFTILQHQENRGVSAARNTLLQAAKGRHIWFVDSDDVMLPGAMNQLAAILDREDPDLVMCDFQTWRSPMRLKHRLRGELHKKSFSGAPEKKLNDRSALLSGLLGPGQLHLWSKISRRSLWDEGLRFPEGKYFEDMRILPRLALRVSTYYYTPKVWIAYRQRSGSILATPSLRKIDDMSETLVGFVREFLGQEPEPSREALFLISYTSARNFISASRHLFRHEPPEHRWRLNMYRRDFLSALALSLSALRFEHFRRGWFVRWFRLSHWLRQSYRHEI